jgi:hypothetical protein
MLLSLHLVIRKVRAVLCSPLLHRLVTRLARKAKLSLSLLVEPGEGPALSPSSPGLPSSHPATALGKRAWLSFNAEGDALPLHPLSDDSPQESGDHPETLYSPRRASQPSGGWWAVTLLLIAVTIVSSTLGAGWLSRWLVPPLLQSTPHHTASPSGAVALGPWDSRPCAASPGPLTCDGRLPLAPGDMEIFAHPQGDGACFDKYSVSVTQNVVATGTSVILGKLSLWWFPRCQSHAAQIYWLGDGEARLSVELHVLHSGTGPWTQDESYTVIYSSGVITGSAAWTVLVWSPAAAVDVIACGTITWQKETGSLCTPRLA